jgi:MFS family permease
LICCDRIAHLFNSSGTKRLQLNRLEKRAAASLALIFALRMLGLFMVLPVFALYGESYLDVTPLLIGVAIGAYGLTQALFQIPMGILSDRYGRKRIIVIGLTLFIAGSFVAANAESIWAVIAGRCLQGMGAIAGAVLALASDLTREEHRSKVMAVIGMCIGLSFMAAMLLGPLLAESYGMSGLFWFTLGSAAFGILLTWFVVPNAVNRIHNRETIPVPTLIRDQLNNRELLKLDLGVFFLHLVLTSLFVVLPLLLVDAGLDIAEHWKMYLPTLVLSIFGMVPLFILSGKGKEKFSNLIAIGLIILATLIFWGWQHQQWFLVGASVLFFAGFNYMEASMPAAVSRIALAGEKGSAMGVFSTSQFMGAFCGGILSGAILQHADIQGVFISVLIICVIWLVIFQKITVPERTKSYTLSVLPDIEIEAETLAKQLADLPGVKEVTVVLEECVAYIKVDNDFKIEQAHKILRSTKC